MTRAQKSWIACGLISSAMALWVGLVALHLRGAVERCAPPWVQKPTRCCLPGQTEFEGRCRGSAKSCPPPLTSAVQGCVARGPAVALGAGVLRLEPNDWDAARSPRAPSASVAAFELDAFEVSHERYRACVRAKLCPALPSDAEPARPVTQVTPDEASAFCHFAGGRLPTETEWIYAASEGGRWRYPWGPHGLLCRRAAFGLVRGPCAVGAVGPELVATRPEGSRLGLFDLAGNVAEWTLADTSPAAATSAENAAPRRFSYVALGGSFRSELPAELKTWTGRRATENERAEDIGFRCAYDASALGHRPPPPEASRKATR
jgi:formylglycine-generating enzyme